MKCQNLFPGRNKKNISKYRLLKILPRVLSINVEKWKTPNHRRRHVCPLTVSLDTTQCKNGEQTPVHHLPTRRMDTVNILKWAF